MVQMLEETLEKPAGDASWMVREVISSPFTVKDMVQRATKGRVQSNLFFSVLQVLIIAYRSKAFIENDGGVGGTTYSGSAGDGAKYHLLHVPSRSLIGDRGSFRLPSPVTYHGEKHHGAELFFSFYCVTDRFI